MQVLVFEDDAVVQLYPITVGRPAYAITCATYRLIDWLIRLAHERGATLLSIVRPHLAELERLDFPQIHRGPYSRREGTLLINARLVPSIAAASALRRLAESPHSALVPSGSTLAAAWIDAGGPLPLQIADTGRMAEYLRGSIVGKVPAIELPLRLFDYPHDVLREHLANFGESLACRLREGAYREVADGVFAAEGARLGDHVVSDTRQGPVLLDAEAAVGPHCFLRGPAYLGPRSRVIEHAAIKDAVSLGHTTKIGGEVEASIVEPYTNKQHHGFLGHSYLGSWINLGAGTCNSDLKNTYGIVKMDYRGEQVSTGMQFLGCIMGDYAKTAINTGIFTGKTIGCCSMVYGFVTTNVPSFVNYARLFGQVTELSPEVMVATQQRMFARRSVVQRPCDIQLIHDMYALTRHERQLAGEPLSL
jgi:glucose-1-phosphate thymidylyltransferase